MTVTTSPALRHSTGIHGVVTIHPRVFGDERGMFVESFRQEWLAPDAPVMVQSNRADRRAGSLVGLHFHRRQADYWYVVSGEALVVLHDLRLGSPTDGTTDVLELSDREHVGLYVPPGVAHGFYARTDLTLTYLVDRYYDPADELGLAWDDPALGVPWPVAAPVLSERDRTNPRRDDIPDDARPVWSRD